MLYLKWRLLDKIVSLWWSGAVLHQQVSIILQPCHEGARCILNGSDSAKWQAPENSFRERLTPDTRAMVRTPPDAGNICNPVTAGYKWEIKRGTPLGAPSARPSGNIDCIPNSKSRVTLFPRQSISGSENWLVSEIFATSVEHSGDNLTRWRCRAAVLVGFSRRLMNGL